MRAAQADSGSHVDAPHKDNPQKSGARAHDTLSDELSLLFHCAYSQRNKEQHFVLLMGVVYCSSSASCLVDLFIHKSVLGESERVTSAIGSYMCCALFLTYP